MCAGGTGDAFSTDAVAGEAAVGEPRRSPVIPRRPLFFVLLFRCDPVQKKDSSFILVFACKFGKS